MRRLPPAVPSQSRCLRVLQQFPPPESPGERKSMQDVLQVIINFSEWGFGQAGGAKSGRPFFPGGPLTPTAHVCPP